MEEPIELRLDEKTTTANHNGTIEQKRAAILEACRRRDLSALRALAESPGGFLTDSIRQQAWPVLLGIPLIDGKTEPDADEAASWKALPRHKDEDQVQLDVNRSFIYYPNDQTESQLSLQKSHLSALILHVLRRHPYLSYFQGYHDIAQVLLLVLPAALRPRALSSLSLLRIRDFMLPSLGPAIAQLRLIPDILRLADPPLWEHLSSTEPFFALSGTLTMYAHDITTLGEIARLFDVLLARDPVFTVYLFAAIVRCRRAELFETPPDEPEMLHSILSKLPAPLDLEGLIAEAGELERKFPPERLPAWRRISRWSVLKTARLPSRGKSGGGQGGAEEEVDGEEHGREFFERQVRELRWAEQKDKVEKWVWQYRRPAGTVGIAILVGLLAVLLRKYSGPGPGLLPGPLVSGMEYVFSLVANLWR
ncbi:GTPase-activating protein gyp10 [Madurella mycetomatis]|uniref:GTPase-activating protein gyp10 n=1 Tax=Madurella mycetomatis TaxID=100816 RepID=A0A175WEC1_9PEZI|nr:GTPase-activating protein gyp10 [Madurella mycetomatis]